ncbi:hypothetical protein GCM10010495_22580 [Kitasatospora herbaricolor]|uniref:hypothetical protein n=1 Tax=Kitasatospora herbaricolor TaxID=68217 RepID=UPI0019842ED9|nr:hypothetical protein [Kitasatospora herbaricolor]MDQ0308955.1 hypothetical protein [Kitasatospora herbaricolor]GGV09215.1 hypothetical protein GCM10010495_22580 [Kitasatospora herbaricolor]
MGNRAAAFAIAVPTTAGPATAPPLPARADATGSPAALHGDVPRLPVWFFGFEAVLAASFDIIKAFPQAWPALVLVGLVNITVSLTVLRGRLRLAKALWRGKETRKVAIGLVAVRIGSHLLLGAVGLGVTSTLGHVCFALVMAALTVGLLAWTQRTALRALGLA